MVMKKKNRLLALTVGLIAGVSLASACFGASTDEWVGKAVNAATALARGNANGAAQQAIGTVNVPLARQTNLSAGLGNVWLRQGIVPSGKFNSPFFNIGSAYNAGLGFRDFSHLPNLSQNVQVSAGNRYLSNTTTLSGNFRRKQS